MDAKSQANVLFYNVADTYKVVRSEGIACFFTVHPSILPGIRHIVGIYPVNWQSTKEFIICDWSPMPRDYQPDEPLDSHLQFSGVCQNLQENVCMEYQLSLIDPHDRICCRQSCDKLQLSSIC